jgi:hypothetical protein
MHCFRALFFPANPVKHALPPFLSMPDTIHYTTIKPDWKHLNQNTICTYKLLNVPKNHVDRYQSAFRNYMPESSPEGPKARKIAGHMFVLQVERLSPGENHVSCPRDPPMTVYLR